MVSKKDIKDYEFDTIIDYFEYIIVSEINGQRSQVRNLINSMSKKQKKLCIDYINEFYSEVSYSDAEIVKDLIIESL